jgi:hypothetical protein
MDAVQADTLNDQPSWWQGLISSIGSVLPDVITAAKAPGGSVHTSGVTPINMQYAQSGNNLLLVVLILAAAYLLLKR